MITGKLGGRRFGDDRQVAIMGVINLTSNSFYSGSIKLSDEEIIATAEKMEHEGADIIDLGARSTAPYRKSEIPSHVEARQLRNALKLLSNRISIPISVDTTRFEPAKAAFDAGASILNDVYGFTQMDRARLARLVSSRALSLILTAHERRSGSGGDPISRVSTALEKGLAFAEEQGIDGSKIAIDPGIGFFTDPVISNVKWNCTILDRLSELRRFDKLILVGASRKKFIGVVSGGKGTQERLSGSLAAASIAAYNGAHIIRTHDVAETLDAVRVARAIREKGLSA